MTTDSTGLPLRDAQNIESSDRIRPDDSVNRPKQQQQRLAEADGSIAEDRRLIGIQSSCRGNFPVLPAFDSIIDTDQDNTATIRASDSDTPASESSQPADGSILQLDADTDRDPVKQCPSHPVDRNRSPSTTTQSLVTVAPKQKKPQNRRSNAQSRGNDPARAKRKIPQGMQAQWRVGAAPSVVLAMSKEDNQVSRVISQARTFYTSMFETVWGPCMASTPFVFDTDNRVELFRDSSVTATALVAAGKPQSAQEVLNRILLGMDDVLKVQHPQLYLVLAEIALGLVNTPNNALRDQIARYLAGRAQVILGAEHPVTVLLTLQLPPKRKQALGQQLSETIIPILLRTFGPDHYQCSSQIFCQARNLVASGQHEEGIRIIENLIERFSQLYGANSLIVCYTKIELANILVSTGSGMKGEFVISDALRTSDMIQAAGLRDEDCLASEKRHRASSIAFPKVAGHRTLGKLHRLRGNLGAARYHYSQAVSVGVAALGERNPAVELARHEFDVVCELEKKQSEERFSPENLCNLTDIVGTPVVC